MSDTETILIVDDEEEVSRTLQEFLERQGHRCLVARTGEEACRVLQTTAVALLLLDVRLPDMNGLEVMRDALRLNDGPDVIVMTGHATADSAMAAVEGSAAGFILKPIELSRLAGIVRRVLARRQLTQQNAQLKLEMDRRLHETEALLAISTVTSSTLDLREALRQICRELTRLIGADAGAAYLHDPLSDRLVPLAGYRVPPEMLPTPLPLNEEGFSATVLKERRLVMSDDVARDPRFTHEMFHTFRHQSGLILPLILDSEVAGAIYFVWRSERRRLSERERSLMQGIAVQVAVLLRNARLFEQAERERRRLAVLYEIGRRLTAAQDPEGLLALLVEEATKLLGVEAAGLRMLEEGDLVVRARTASAARLLIKPRIKVGHSLTGTIVATGEPLLVSDLAADIRFDPEHKQGALADGFHAFLGVPLRLHGGVIGALMVYTKQRREFQPDDVSLLSALGDQAVLAIHKAQMLADAQEGRAVVERLSHLAIAMQSSWDRAERLKIFAAGAHDVVGFDRMNVLLATPDGIGLELLTSYGDDGEVPPVTLPLSPEAGPHYEAFRTRQVVAVTSDEDLRSLPPLDARFLRDPHFRSSRFVITPLVVGDRVIGVVSADNKLSRRPIRAAAIGWLSLLCQHLAMALEESQLYADAQARERETTQLYEVTTLLGSSLDKDWIFDQIGSKVVELLRCDASGIYVYDPQRDGLTVRRGLHLPTALTDNLLLKPGEGVAGRAFQTRRPVWTRDRLNDPSLVYTPAADQVIRAHAPRSYLAAPILIRGEVFGVVVSYFLEPHEFSGREVQLMSTLAGHAGIAIDNARHYEESRTQRARLAQIFDATSDGILLVGPDGSIAAANRQAGELLNVDAGALLGSSLDEVTSCSAAPLANGHDVLPALRAVALAPEREAQGDLALPASGRVLQWVAQPTRTASGAAMGSTLTLRDVTHERQVSQMKSDFVSFVTHQLRTPLAGIKWMLELASQEAGLPDEAASFVGDAREAADRLIGLVNDLLDVSRLERGTLVISPQPVALGSLTRSVLDEAVVLVEAKRHRLRVNRVDEGPTVSGDPQLLRQAIVNLVSNAIKYTPEGGDIDIRLETDQGQACWSICDSGIGIPKAAMARLFEKFYRADNVTAIETEGTGLGLYLVRLIMEHSGGRVWCESVEGAGATFAFTLPLLEGLA